MNEEIFTKGTIREMDVKHKKSRWYHRHFGDFRLKMMTWKHEQWKKKLERMKKRYNKGKQKFCLWCFLVEGKSKRYKHLKLLKRKCSKCKTKLISSLAYKAYRKECDFSLKRNMFYLWQARYWKVKGIISEEQLEEYLIKKRICPSCGDEVVSLISFLTQSKNIMKCVECTYEKEMIKN